MSRLGNIVLGAAVLLAMTAAAAAQDYPTKPIRLIVPFAPGGSTDLVARVIANGLSEKLGKQVVVDNRPGAGGIMGTEMVVNALPDGHTLLLVSMAHAINPHLHKLSHDPIKAFAPITIFGKGASVLCVHPSVPANTVQELIALARSKPGQLNIGHAGAGSFMHLSTALLVQLAGIDVVQIPFKGGGPVVIDVMGGHTQIMLGSLVSTMPHIRSGKLKALGVSDSKRSALLPDLPTISEAGIPGYEAANWWGAAAPAGTPQPIIARLHKEITTVLDSDAVRKQFAADGNELMGMSTAEFARFMETELEKWGRVIKAANIKAE